MFFQNAPHPHTTRQPSTLTAPPRRYRQGLFPLLLSILALLPLLPSPGSATDAPATSDTLPQQLTAAHQDAANTRKALEEMLKFHSLPSRANELVKLGAALDTAEKNLPAAPTDPANTQAALQKLLAAKRAILLANPRLDFKNILFVKKHFLPPAEKQGNHMCDQYFGFHAIPEGGLFILENAFGPTPRPRDLLANAVCENGRFKGKKLDKGGFLAPALSYDAKTILFCYTEAAPTLYTWTEKSTYHIFKINTDGTHLTQLTDGPVNDLHPCWLPNGRIAFMSERRGGYGRCHGRPVPIYTLHSMNPDGTDIVCLSYHESNEWQPSVNNDGMIVYTRWDYVDRGFNQAHHPWITTPDGRDARAIQGNYGKAPNARPLMEMDVRAIPGSPQYVATAAAHHGQAYGSLVLIDPRVEDDDAMAPLKILTPDAKFPEATCLHTEDQKYATAWPLDENNFLCVHDPAGCTKRGKNNRYGIYLIDTFGNKELIYNDPAISSLSPIPIQPRPVPPVVPQMTTAGQPKTAGANGQMGAAAIRPSSPDQGSPHFKDAPTSFALVGLANVYDTRYAFPAGTVVTALRIIQLAPKTTPKANHPRIGYGDQKNARLILGTVPVETDGSAWFRLPNNKPVYFQAINQDGVAIQTMRSDTYTHPGETLLCQGCHAPAHRAPEFKKDQLKAFRRAPSDITPETDGASPLSYPRLVQPVLDKYCADCHAKNPKLPDLHQGNWENNKNNWYTSYLSLQKYACYFDHAAWNEPRSKPGQFGALGSKLYPLLAKTHHGCKLPPAELHRIALWLDANSDFFGTFEDIPRQAAGEKVALRLE